MKCTHNIELHKILNNLKHLIHLFAQLLHILIIPILHSQQVIKMILAHIITSNRTNITTKMQLKNGKQYLPQTYQAFQALRKKNNKVQSLVVKVFQSSTEANPFASFNQELPKELKKSNQIKEADSDEEKVTTPSNIVEKTVYSDFQRMFDEFQNCRFEAISNKINREMEKLKEEIPARVVSVNTLLKDLSVTSLENIRNIEKQLKSSSGRRNVEKIDTMLSFNKFFVILNKEKRVKIYDHCEFVVYDEGHEIYKEGDIQDFMYVVVKGCVKQYEKKTTSFHEKITVNFISHYEGSNFGQAQLVGQKNQKAKRHHTAVTAQKSYLLKIDNQFYRDLITNSAEDDFQKKLSALLSTTIFIERSKIFVTPLLSTLEKKTLNFGEVLIRQGDPVKKLYFIGEGNLQIVYVLREKRSVKHLNIEEKPKNFQIRGGSSKKPVREKNYSIHHSFYYSKDQFEKKKEFVYGNKQVIGDQLEYNDQIVFDQLRNGSFFGGKSFLSSDLRQQKADNSQFFDTALESKLTVLASTIYTTVYSLDEKKFFSLSDSLQKVILEGIMNNTYFDQRNIMVKVQAQKEWKKYAEGLVAKVIRNKKERNQSFRL